MPWWWGWPPELVVGLFILIAMSLTVHEFAHSLVTIQLGDDTPRRQGRLTLNPLAHIDPMGFILLVIVGFGWAKPVQINPANLKRPRRDEVLISLAGPFSNLLFAMIAVLVLKATYRGRETEFVILMEMLATINVGLAVFNMIPVPPLDGSHLVTAFLGRINAAVAATYFRFGAYALLAIVVIQAVTRKDILHIGRLTSAVVTWMFRLVGG